MGADRVEGGGGLVWSGEGEHWTGPLSARWLASDKLSLVSGWRQANVSYRLEAAAGDANARLSTCSGGVSPQMRSSAYNIIGGPGASEAGRRGEGSWDLEADKSASNLASSLVRVNDCCCCRRQSLAWLALSALAETGWRPSGVVEICAQIWPPGLDPRAPWTKLVPAPGEGCKLAGWLERPGRAAAMEPAQWQTSSTESSWVCSLASESVKPWPICTERQLAPTFTGSARLYSALLARFRPRDGGRKRAKVAAGLAALLGSARLGSAC